ncbi:hypothetical protein [Brevundimonas nasdae]|uniref:Uncharacterized protein n=1 Tax=Brevundimonas nasdae TaxID=172043 RepID=A0ACD4VK60_9CAUL|nr:hypothetical protein [Brevundimonas nasdae]WOB78317.1 hypothetical protein PZA08_13555 [Brevundimonas nasdae]
MKLAYLMAGAAALALAAAPAMAGTVNQGAAVGGFSKGNYGAYTSPNGTTDMGFIDFVKNNGLGGQDSGISVFTATGSSANNNGTASNNDGATFTLKGAVSTDCAYYTGNASTTIDFGTIGIYASDDTGPANAFDMTAPANVTIDTNLAGCNTSNTVTVSKNDIRGLVNNSGAGYDSNVFQANLPYSVTGTYTAGAVGSTAAATNGNYINLAANANSTSASHGAWKSAMALNVNIPVPSKSLLAGAYEGQLTVNIQAF